MALGLGGITDAIGITNYGGQEDAIRNAVGYFDGLTLPQLQELDLEMIGQLSPEQANAILTQGSAFNEVYADPRMKAKQNEVLDMLQEISDSGGLTSQDRAMLGRIERDEDVKARGAREAIIQNAQARGVGGSGLELGAQMINQQEAATRQSIRDQEVAAMAEQRKMDALMQSGQLGGQMRGQDFAEQSRVAEAKDLMDRFNASNQQQTELANVAAQNQASAYNMQTAQQIAADKAKWKAQIPQMNFQNQLGIASGKAGAQQNLAQMYGQQSQAGLGAIGSGALAYAAFASDVNVKENIEMAPDEIDSFLNDLTGYKYNYEDPEKYGEGERLGVMTQDMSQNPIGAEAVIEDEEGTQGIDAGKALSAILAGLGRLNEKLENSNGR